MLFTFCNVTYMHILINKSYRQNWKYITRNFSIIKQWRRIKGKEWRNDIIWVRLESPRPEYLERTSTHLQTKLTYRQAFGSGRIRGFSLYPDPVFKFLWNGSSFNTLMPDLDLFFSECGSGSVSFPGSGSGSFFSWIRIRSSKNHGLSWEVGSRYGQYHTGSENPPTDTKLTHLQTQN